MLASLCEAKRASSKIPEPLRAGVTPRLLPAAHREHARSASASHDPPSRASTARSPTKSHSPAPRKMRIHRLMAMRTVQPLMQLTPIRCLRSHPAIAPVSQCLHQIRKHFHLDQHPAAARAVEDPHIRERRIDQPQPHTLGTSHPSAPRAPAPRRPSSPEKQASRSNRRSGSLRPIPAASARHTKDSSLLLAALRAEFRRARHRLSTRRAEFLSRRNAARPRSRSSAHRLTIACPIATPAPTPTPAPAAPPGFAAAAPSACAVSNCV